MFNRQRVWTISPRGKGVGNSFPEGKSRPEHCEDLRFHLRQCKQWRDRAGFAHWQAGHTRFARGRRVFKRSTNSKNVCSKSDIISGNRLLSKRTGDESPRSCGSDAVYHGHFQMQPAAALSIIPTCRLYLMDLYQQPGSPTPSNFDHIKQRH